MKGGLNRGWNFEPEIWPDLTGLLTGRAPWLTGIYQIFLVVGNKSWKPHFASGLVKIQKNLSLVKHTNCVYLKEWGTVGETYIWLQISWGCYELLRGTNLIWYESEVCFSKHWNCHRPNQSTWQHHKHPAMAFNLGNLSYRLIFRVNIWYIFKGEEGSFEREFYNPLYRLWIGSENNIVVDR